MHIYKYNLLHTLRNNVGGGDRWGIDVLKQSASVLRLQGPGPINTNAHFISSSFLKNGIMPHNIILALRCCYKYSIMYHTIMTTQIKSTQSHIILMYNANTSACTRIK